MSLPGFPGAARTLVMGVVNVTPDSFSDGGAWLEPDAAIAHGRAMLSEGADLLDIGGESTRPGATRPSVAVELARTIPVVRALAAEGAAVSIDTMRAEVAAAALDAGAMTVNDVSGGLADPDMLALVAARGVPYIAMHWRGHSADMQARAVYDDVIDEVCRERPVVFGELGESEAGVEDEPLGGDACSKGCVPACGELTAYLDRIVALGHPVLYAASRKGFLGRVGRPAEAPPRPVTERDVATAATSVLAAAAGAWAVRVHDVRGTRDALDVWEATVAARSHG